MWCNRMDSGLQCVEVVLDQFTVMVNTHAYSYKVGLLYAISILQLEVFL